MLPGKLICPIWQGVAYSNVGITALSFEAMHIAPAGGIAWGGDAELCPDALYMRLTGKSVAELMPEAQFLVENA